MIFSLFPYICYSAVQHTLYRVSVCTVLLPILDMPIWPVPLPHQTVYSLHLLSLSAGNIFVAWYLVCNAWSSSAIIPLSVSPTRSPPNSHTNLSSRPISCLSTLLIHCSRSNLLSHVFFTDCPNFLITVECLPFLFYCSQFIGLILLLTLLQL